VEFQIPGHEEEAILLRNVSRRMDKLGNDAQKMADKFKDKADQLSQADQLKKI